MLKKLTNQEFISVEVILMLTKEFLPGVKGPRLARKYSQVHVDGLSVKAFLLNVGKHI